MFQSTGSVACLWTGNLMKKRSRLNTFLSQRDENRRKESHDFSKCQKCPEKQKSIPKNFVRQAKSVFFRGENLKEGSRNVFNRNNRLSRMFSLQLSQGE